MSAEFVSLGYEVELDVDSFPFAVVSVQYRETADEADVTDTEAGDKKKTRAGLKQFEADIEVQCASDEDYYTSGAGWNLSPGNDVHLKVWPHGRGDGTGLQRWNIPVFHIFGGDGSAQVQGSPPQTIRFRGKSWGEYSRPGES